MQGPQHSLGILPKMEELVGGGMGTKMDRSVILKSVHECHSACGYMDMPCILALLYVQNVHGKYE